MARSSMIPTACLAVALTAGCGVPKKHHRQVLDDLAATQARLSDSEKDRRAKRARIQALEGELSSTQSERDTKSASARDKSARIKENEERIAALLEDVKATREQLLEVQRQQARTQERLAAFRDLSQRFRALVDAGELTVSFRNGQMVLVLPSEVLFPSGKARLSKQGEQALARVLAVLQAFKDRRFLVAGHTDNVPIRSTRFPNNWHLSTARAVSVVEFMVQAGFDPKNLAAAGNGEFDPVAPNDTPDNRARNRRIEIILVPDLSELPNLTEPT